MLINKFNKMKTIYVKLNIHISVHPLFGSSRILDFNISLRKNLMVLTMYN